MKPTGDSMLQNDLKYQFFKNMEGLGELPKNFLDHVFKKTLALKGVSLTKGATLSLQNALKLIDVKRLILEQNSISDHDFAKLLQVVPKNLKSIIYRSNEFGFDSFHFLEKILDQITELQLSNCKMPQTLSEELFYILFEKSQYIKHNLRRLSLNGIKATTYDISLLAYFIKRYARNLTHFDFSDNAFTPEIYKDIVHALSRNTSLKFLNLSGNQIHAAPVRYKVSPEIHE